jgi:GNAT superfamily N-acetyltransferase
MSSDPGWETISSMTGFRPTAFEGLYGRNHRVCSTPNAPHRFILSTTRRVDLNEQQQLCDDVGWSRLPIERVRLALENSLMVVGLWLHDPHQPRLVGFARCIGDGVIEAIVCDVAVHPNYQGIGLGKQLMTYVLDALRSQQVNRVTLFADPDVVEFYSAQGWELEPQQRRCAYWHED